MLGLHKSPYHGFSIEFSQHRQYMQGDAIKDIDWKVYGKTDRFFIKQYEEETNLKSYILLDVSNSMSFSSEGQISKFEYAKLLTAALSYIMIKQNDAVGVAFYSDTIEKYLPPKASDIYLREIVSHLINAKTNMKTDTVKALSLVAEKIKRKGLVIIISDFFDDVKSVLTSLKHFRFMKNEVIVFQILDPLERSFAFGRDAIFKDLESAEEMTTQSIQVQRAYKEAMTDFIALIKNECVNNGIEYNLIETSQSFDKALYSYLQKRIKLH
ncbi:MAG: DUF58 domain-containing protein [Chlorobiaceae bacterium]|nr:DUF58 domain-containing protein [Chlorobiaceae bacterium]MBA4309584.1 DUF58 domain-containing protein [Chlorobiaceae bacterium]